jgi:hypothetical protein
VTIAPDASQVAVAVDPIAGEVVPAGDEEVWVVGINGSGPHRIAAGQEPAWRPAGTSLASAPPTAAQPQDTSVTVNCDGGYLLGQGEVVYLCDDGHRYDFNPDLKLLTRDRVSRYSKSVSR